MKKQLFFLLCLLGLVGTISAKRIVDIHRSNGLFGHYRDLDQTFMGYFQNGTEWWILNCENPGFVNCSLRATAGKTQRESEIEAIENIKLSDLMIEIEADEIEDNNTSGSTTRHYQSTLTDGSTVDIYIVISWQPDPGNSENTLFHAEITTED
jgi:hypothetical protein